MLQASKKISKTGFLQHLDFRQIRFLDITVKVKIYQILFNSLDGLSDRCSRMKESSDGHSTAQTHPGRNVDNFNII